MSTRKRFDGTLIKEVDPFHSIVPYVMPKRTEAEVSLTETLDITNLNKFIEKKNKKDGTNVKLFHCICMAVAKTIYHRPKLNIFVSGRHFYQRKDITLSFVAKQKFDDKAEEVLMFMKVEPDMTLDNVSSIILGDVKKAREKKGNDLDKTMNFVGKLPRFILEIVFFVIRRLEYHGRMPKDLMKGDPNYSTVLLSNLGSIGAKSCYHHLSNYGTCSFMITIGKSHTIKEKNDVGKYVEKDVVDITVTLDERIADGFYFAKSLKIINYLFENPDELMKTIGEQLPEGICEKR